MTDPTLPKAPTMAKVYFFIPNLRKL
jgi:hypothetical protein